MTLWLRRNNRLQPTMVQALAVMIVTQNLLFVDAGNYSRSPAAEIIARTVFKRHHIDAVAGSAGLKDKHAGGPADPRTVELCALRGLDLSGFVCRQISLADFAAADRIFAMDRENLDALYALCPRDATVRPELLLPGAEVPDPFFGGPEGFEHAINLIEWRIWELAGELARAAGRQG